MEQSETEPIGGELRLSTSSVKAVFLVFSLSIVFLSEIQFFPLLTYANFEKTPRFLNDPFLEGK